MSSCSLCRSTEARYWYVLGLFRSNPHVGKLCRKCRVHNKDYPEYFFKTKKQAELAIITYKMLGDPNDAEANVKSKTYKRVQ